MFLLITLDGDPFDGIFGDLGAHDSLSTGDFQGVRHEPVSHRPHNRINIVEAGVTFGGERLLQPLTGHADFVGHVRDAFDAGDDAQGRQQCS